MAKETTKKIKTGKIDVPIMDFSDENMMAHISLRLPVRLVKELKLLALTKDYNGRYQVLMREVLQNYVSKHKGKKKHV